MPDPLISLIIAAIFLAIGLLIFWPENGLFWRWQRVYQRSERVLWEDGLKHIFHSLTHQGKPSAESIAGALSISTSQAAEVIKNLQSRDFIHLDGNDLTLTPEGREYALRIIRAHRIYERYLADETGYEEADWHTKAHDIEHQLTPEAIEKLASQIGNPTHDPHGDPIPTPDGTIVYQPDRIALTQLPLNEPGRIVHLEDEPQTIYAQLVAEGLHVGQEVHLIESTSQRVRFWTGSGEVVLAPILAANISVVPVKEAPKPVETILGQPLTSIKPGQEAQVAGLSPLLRGVERRRLMDLGLLPGTTIEVEMESAGGNPIAYRIRGAVIALRKSQAELINVYPETKENKKVDPVAG